MPDTNFADVGKFNEKFGFNYSGPPRELPVEWAWRLKFLKEEIQELEDAVAAGDLVEQFDALLDITYVAMGTALLQGFPWQHGWDEVQRSNMAKRLSIPHEGRGHMDVRKPEGWKAPDLAEVLQDAKESKEMYPST